MRKLKLEELGRDNVQEFKAKEKTNLTIVLDNLRSGLNVGSVFRTADSFACEQVILTGICPQPPHKEILKTAIGANNSMDWIYVEQVENAVANLKSQGYFIIGIEQTDQSIPLHSLELPLDAKVAIVMGNEVEGIHQDVLPLLDQAVEIPQFGTKHSLNVAVCAGIVIHELFWNLRG